ncbi:DNA-directed RNA polymerases I, II, and III subunit RPABC4 [Fusarium oxysporum f. sp. albedinis]|jgi:hypothetical protein|nr:DNA-directed RNA polymerases I, II, and III subunit RPABC4 [Fusarium oxysporum f. sp. albedinis]
MHHIGPSLPHPPVTARQVRGRVMAVLCYVPYYGIIPCLSSRCRNAIPPWPILRFFSYFGTTLDGLVGSSYAWWYFLSFCERALGLGTLFEFFVP